MRTEEAIQQIKPYLIGDLTPKEVAILEGHLDVDETAKWYHQRYYRQLLPVLKQPVAEPSPGVIDDLFAKAREVIKDENQVRRPILRAIAGEVWRMRAVAAAVLIAAGIMAALVLVPSKTVHSPALGTLTVSAPGVMPERTSQFFAGHEVVVRDGGSAVLTMPSGIQLRFAGGTKARVDSVDGKEVAVTLGRGHVMLDGSTRKDWTGVKVNVFGGESGFIAALTEGTFTTPTVASVSYAGPEFDWKARGSGVYDLELTRAPIARVLGEIAPLYGKTVDVGAADVLSKRYIDLRGHDLNWDAFVGKLAAAGVAVEHTAGNAWAYRDGAGRVYSEKAELFDLTVVRGVWEYHAPKNPVKSSGRDHQATLTTHSISGSVSPAGQVTVMDTAPANLGETEKALVKLFLGTPGSGSLSPGLLPVVERVASPVKHARVETDNNAMLVQMDDGNKITVHQGKRTQIGDIKGTVVHAGADSVIIQQDDGEFRRVGRNG